MTRKIIYNILVARGYDVSKDFIEEDEEITLIDKLKNNGEIDEELEKIYIFYPNITKKVGVPTIRQYIREMHDNEVNNAIIIVQDAVTAFAKKEFSAIKNFNIEYFKKNELKIDITEHVLVPRHVLISEADKKELFKIYKIKGDKLPKILSSDPISRYYGAKRGQVFKIYRNSESSGQTINYRIVT